MIINPYSFAGEGAAAFDPLDLSPAIWLDASDASTLYDATSGGSLVAADADIARWEDKSGNSRHALQATSGVRPVRKTSIQNAKDVVRFNADWMESAFAYSSDQLSVFWVSIRITNSDAYGGSGMVFAYPSLDYATNLHFIPAFLNGGSDLVTFRNGFKSTATHPGNNVVFLAHTEFDGTNNTFRLNGNASTAVSSTGIFGFEKMYLGRRWDEAIYSNQDICEILVFPTALAQSDREDVELYLNEKWGIY